MNAVPIEADLPGARRELRTAISNLIDHTTTHIERDPTDNPDSRASTTTVWGDSLYQQLHDVVPGAQGTQLGATARSMPPMWVDASDLLREIDTAVAVWQHDPGIFDGNLTTTPTPETVRRLTILRDQQWRPQDVHGIEQMTRILTAWAAEIRELLDPTPHLTLPNPCPACGTSVVYRQDSAGETVRQPALRIGTHGCECQKCRTTWDPSHFVHLSRVLGYELDGVLE